MVAKKAAPVDEVPTGRLGRVRWMFKTGRQTLIFCYYLLWICIDLSLLGLVSQQIHRYGNSQYNYPGALYYHALGLNLFSTIFFFIVALFHWALGHLPLTFLMFCAGVFFGTSAGILTETPFGHGLQCGNPLYKFPENYRPFVRECSRITAITGLSWAMFALAVIAFFFFLIDKFSCVSKRQHVYEPYPDPEEGHQKSPIRH